MLSTISKDQPPKQEAKAAAPPLSLSSYWKPSHTFGVVKSTHAEREDLPDTTQSVSISGRIIGRRKASQSLLFLDLESDGETLQVMIDSSILENDTDQPDLMRSIATSCHRGAIVGIDGYPGRS